MLQGIINRLLISHRSKAHQTLWQRLHIDLPLLCSISLLMCCGMLILYSAGNEDLGMVIRQLIRFSIAIGVMLILAQIPPQRYQHFAPWIYAIILMLLSTVLIAGHIGKGAQRWLSIGLVRFQPSEIMKLALPMTLAWYLHAHRLPPTKSQLVIVGSLIVIPALLIAKQPDLGTALLISAAGISVIFLAGISWRLIILCMAVTSASIPLLWHYLHDYQRERVLTFLSPERDPLGSGYHIIQSKIAIGSGGLFGKGWLNGTQSHLQFLPEHATDFIFAVCGEELGLIGTIILLVIYLMIIGRCFYISLQAQDTFSRLLAGGLAFTFFVSVFINIGMVTGILPVVGLPLPLVSYGGTSVVTMMASFGILMSLHTHRKLVRT